MTKDLKLWSDKKKDFEISMKCGNKYNDDEERKGKLGPVNAERKHKGYVSDSSS